MSPLPRRERRGVAPAGGRRPPDTRIIQLRPWSKHLDTRKHIHKFAVLRRSFLWHYGMYRHIVSSVYTFYRHSGCSNGQSSHSEVFLRASYMPGWLGRAPVPGRTSNPRILAQFAVSPQQWIPNKFAEHIPGQCNTTSARLNANNFIPP